MEKNWRQCVVCGKRIAKDTKSKAYGWSADYPGGFVCGVCRDMIYEEVKDCTLG